MSATNPSVQASSSSPTTVRDILCAYSHSEQADKEVLLAILKAKTAEDQRIAALASLNEQCVVYAMQIQQEQNAATSSNAQGSGAAVAQGSHSASAARAGMRAHSLTRMPYSNLSSTPPSPPYSPSAIISSSSTARAPGPRPYSNNLSSARICYHQSSERQQKYPPHTISLPPIQAAALQFGSVSPPSGPPQSDAAVLPYPALQDRMSIQNFLSE